MSTLEMLKRLQKLGLPAKWIVPVLEAVEGEPDASPKAVKKKRRKRRTPKQMEAARAAKKKK